MNQLKNQFNQGESFLENKILPINRENLDFSQKENFEQSHNHDGRNSQKLDYNNLDNLPTVSSFTHTDRGDSSAFDIDSPTIDNDWHDWDLSAIVPAGTKLVRVVISTRATAADAIMYFRKNGNSNVFNVEARMQQIANSYTYHTLLVPVGDDLIIEYKFPTTFTNVSFLIGGWFA